MKRTADSRATTRRRTRRWALLPLVVVALVVAAFVISESRDGASAAQALTGQWTRPDGGYVLALSRIEAGGKVAASYFNPNPIRVSKAEVTRKNGALELFVELRDEGYPGCTYRLRYDPANDQLVGKYYQAALRETYEVTFTRMN